MITRRRILLSVGGIVALVVALAVSWHIAAISHDYDQRSGCQSNLKQIARAFNLYLEDFGGKFPLTVVGGTAVKGWRFLPGKSVQETANQQGSPVGWADAIQPYVGGASLYLCPAADGDLHRSQPDARGYTDYWFNANLSGIGGNSLASRSGTLLIGEGNDGRDASDATYSRSRLPAAWLADPTMPPWRHIGGANYIYTDGHVAWIPPAQVTRNFGRANCFAVR